MNAPRKSSDFASLVASTRRGREQIYNSAVAVNRQLAELARTIEARRGSVEVDDLRRHQQRLRRLRDQHVRGMRDTAFTLQEIATALGVSMSMVRKILAADDQD